MLLNVNTYANSIIESSFAFMMFMELQMNVYLPYSFNCWRKWMCILRKWTAKGVNIFNYGANSLVSLEWKENIKYLGDLIDSKWSRTHTFHLLHLRLASLWAFYQDWEILSHKLCCLTCIDLLFKLSCPTGLQSEAKLLNWVLKRCWLCKNGLILYLLSTC